MEVGKMKFNWLTVSALALSLGTASGMAGAQAYDGQEGPPPPGYQQQGGGQWDAPPQEFREVQRQGFHDGVEGARRDVDNHRQLNVNNREEYRRPRVDRSMRREYREGFRRGYDMAARHMMNDGDRPHHDHDRDDRDRDPH
jgi:Spy/CpxP family protein refolding chaperone